MFFSDLDEIHSYLPLCDSGNTVNSEASTMTDAAQQRASQGQLTPSADSPMLSNPHQRSDGKNTSCNSETATVKH